MLEDLDGIDAVDLETGGSLPEAITEENAGFLGDHPPQLDETAAEGAGSGIREPMGKA